MLYFLINIFFSCLTESRQGKEIWLSAATDRAFCPLYPTCCAENSNVYFKDETRAPETKEKWETDASVGWRVRYIPGNVFLDSWCKFWEISTWKAFLAFESQRGVNVGSKENGGSKAFIPPWGFGASAFSDLDITLYCFIHVCRLG